MRNSTYRILYIPTGEYLYWLNYYGGSFLIQVNKARAGNILNNFRVGKVTTVMNNTNYMTLYLSMINYPNLDFTKFSLEVAHMRNQHLSKSLFTLEEVVNEQPSLEHSNILPKIIKPHRM